MTAHALSHSEAMTLRHLRGLIRQPWFVAINLVQPVIWLLIFGALFERVVDIPGFGGGDYADFLLPGVVVMTALFSGGWLGMGVIWDLERGVIDRFLVSPVSRGALIAGPLGYQAVVTVIQSLILVGLGMAAGAEVPGGAVGVIVLIAASILLVAGFGSLSIAFGLLMRREESLIGAVQLIILPASFLSATFMELSLAPAWIQDVARFNPVNWAVVAGREALGSDVDWGLVGSRLGLLAGFALACAALAARAFRAYQRSI
jgi:ABC-2 type transport system permease protein